MMLLRIGICNGIYGLTNNDDDAGVFGNANDSIMVSLAMYWSKKS